MDTGSSRLGRSQWGTLATSSNHLGPPMGNGSLGYEMEQFRRQLRDFFEPEQAPANNFSADNSTADDAPPATSSMSLVSTVRTATTRREQAQQEAPLSASRLNA